MSIERPEGPKKSAEGMSGEDVSALAETLAAFDEGKRQANEKLEKEKVRLEELSTTDEMTGLANRRAFMQRGAELMSDMQRNGRKEGTKTVSIIFGDLDKFKSVNDTHGHDAGDQVIKAFAEVLKKNVRTGDMAVRLGGEEMLVVLRNMTPEQAAQRAEKIRQEVSSLTFPDIAPDFKITVSLGVETATRETYEGSDLGKLLHRADNAVYAAKNGGRNQVHQFQEGVTPEKPQKEDKRKEGETVA